MGARTWSLSWTMRLPHSSVLGGQGALQLPGGSMWWEIRLSACTYCAHYNYIRCIGQLHAGAGGDSARELSARLCCYARNFISLRIAASPLARISVPAACPVITCKHAGLHVWLSPRRSA